MNLVVNYSHSMVRSPSYKEYLGYLNIGPLFRVLIHQNHLLELFAGYTDKEYFQPALASDEDRNSEGLNAYISWIWSFKKGAF